MRLVKNTTFLGSHNKNPLSIVWVIVRKLDLLDPLNLCSGISDLSNAI